MHDEFVVALPEGCDFVLGSVCHGAVPVHIVCATQDTQCVLCTLPVRAANVISWRSHFSLSRFL